MEDQTSPTIGAIAAQALETVPAENRDLVLRLAVARWDRYNPAFMPRWHEMADGDRASAIVEAHHWIRAAHTIGLSVEASD